MAKGDPFYMTAKYSGRCGQCNKDVPASSRVVYAPNGKKIFCVRDGAGCGDLIMQGIAKRSHTPAAKPRNPAGDR